MTDSTRRQSPRESFDVLLVEDNPGDVRLTEEALGETECETSLHVVNRGDDALEELARREHDDGASLPHIVLLDLNLPGRNGHELLSTIRADPGLQRLPVIVLTSSRATEDVEKSYGEQANAYLTKPTDHDEFVALAKTVDRFWFDHVRLPTTA